MLPEDAAVLNSVARNAGRVEHENLADAGQFGEYAIASTLAVPSEPIEVSDPVLRSTWTSKSGLPEVPSLSATA